MTYRDYISNPMGKSNAVLNSIARESIRSDYKKRYDSIMLREKGHITYNLYRDEKKNIFVAYLRIPSETIEKFYYDVVLKFNAHQDIENAGRNLELYDIHFFSNDPAFTYTYAYVFYHNDLFIKELKDKMSEKAIKEKAHLKNPGQNVGYVKTLYFAYLFMKEKNLFSRDIFDMQTAQLNFDDLKRNISNADDKIDSRQREGEKKKTRKKIQNKQNERRLELIAKHAVATKPRTITKVSSVPKVKTVKTVKVNKKKR